MQSDTLSFGAGATFVNGTPTSLESPRGRTKGKLMSEQRVAVPLLEGVFSSAEALALSHTATIGGIECRLRLPREGPRSSRLRPPDDEKDLDLDWAHTD